MSGVKLFHTFLLSFIFTSGAASFAPLPAELDGSMMPYDFDKVQPFPELPDSLKAIHISYVARHGARFLSSPKKIANIEKELYDASLKNRLTNEGEAFFSLLKDINLATDSRWGLLSSVGMEEEQKLAGEIAGQFPELIKSGKANSISTFVPRVIMTMYEFNHTLARHFPDAELYTASGHQFDSLLYCFDTFSRYRDFRNSGSWKEIYDKFVDSHVSPEPARRLFGRELDNNKHRLRRLTMEMYGVVQGCRAAGFEPPTTRWFSEEEYRQCYLASNLVHFLRNTPNEIDPWAAPATSMLIERIISDADEALSNKTDVTFSGYFGHAETLLPLLATMNIPGCYYSGNDYDSLNLHWNLAEITPLGANLMIIFYRSQSGNIYVELRLNGRNIPAYPDAPDLITWNGLKDYWKARIGHLGSDDRPAPHNRPKANLL